MPDPVTMDVSPAADALQAVKLASPGQPAPSLSPQAVRDSLRYSIKDGVAWSVMSGAGERYVAPFIILGHGGLWRLGAISALPALVGAIVQCFAADAVDAVGRRKPFTVGAALAQALTWVPFCVGIFLPHGAGYWLMLAAFALYIGFGNLGAPAWNSLMGDLVPEHRRGRYFGIRNALIGAGLVTSTLAAGWWVTYAKDKASLALLGLSGQTFAFLAVFAVACVARLISTHYLGKMQEPPYHRQASDHFTLLDFIRRAPQAHFGRFVFYCTLLHAGVGFLAPYLAWYMLDVLKFTPVGYAWIGVANWVAYFGSMVLWGRLADRIGNKRVLAIGGVGTAVTPLLLLFSDSFWWFAAVQTYDGLVFSAFGLGAVNYLFDAVTPPKRARCSAYNALFVAIGMAAGIFAGAVVATTMPIPLVVAGVPIAHPFKLLLIGSALLRVLPNLVLLWTFDEFRLRRPVFAGAWRAPA